MLLPSHFVPAWPEASHRNDLNRARGALRTAKNSGIRVLVREWRGTAPANVSGQAGCIRQEYVYFVPNVVRTRWMPERPYYGLIVHDVEENCCVPGAAKAVAGSVLVHLREDTRVESMCWLGEECVALYDGDRRVAGYRGRGGPQHLRAEEGGAAAAVPDD